MNLAIGMGF